MTDTDKAKQEREVEDRLEAAFAVWVRQVRPNLPARRDWGLSAQRDAFRAGAVTGSLLTVEAARRDEAQALELLRDIDKYGLGPERSRRLREMIRRLTP